MGSSNNYFRSYAELEERWHAPRHALLHRRCHGKSAGGELDRYLPGRSHLPQWDLPVVDGRADHAWPALPSTQSQTQTQAQGSSNNYFRSYAELEAGVRGRIV